MASLVSRRDAHEEGMMACLGKMEVMDLKANPEEIQSEAEHQEVPKEQATVKPVGGLRKRHRGQNLAAERHCKPKDWSWRTLASACRRTTCLAKVAQRNGNVIGKNQTRDNMV
jgi:hypothetical protein